MNMASSNPQDVQDDLCCLASGYLRHAEPERALVFLLLAMHIATPTARVMLLLGKCFIAQKSEQKARIVLERYERTFGSDKISGFLLAKCDRLAKAVGGARTA
jgi:hypothetical protein